MRAQGVAGVSGICGLWGWGGGCVEDSGTLLGGIRVSPFGMVFRGGSMKSLNVMLVVR